MAAMDNASNDDTLEAVVLFRDDLGTGAEASRKIAKLLGDLARGEDIEFNVFSNLGGAAVRAKRGALRKLLEMADVTAATLNRSA